MCLRKKVQKSKSQHFFYVNKGRLLLATSRKSEMFTLVWFISQTSIEVVSNLLHWFCDPKSRRPFSVLKVFCCWAIKNYGTLYPAWNLSHQCGQALKCIELMCNWQLYCQGDISQEMWKNASYITQYDNAKNIQGVGWICMMCTCTPLVVNGDKNAQ